MTRQRIELQTVVAARNSRLTNKRMTFFQTATARINPLAAVTDGYGRMHTHEGRTDVRRQLYHDLSQDAIPLLLSPQCCR